MLKLIKIRGKEYAASRITRIDMKKGIVKIWYMSSPFSAEKVVTAKFKECDFVDDEKWKIQ